VSVTFYGLTSARGRIILDVEDRAHLNLNDGNAAAFLRFLGLDPGPLAGEVTIPEARRAVMRARATFDRRVCSYTREGSEAKEIGCRVIVAGIGPDYFARRLDDFERFLGAVAKLGAMSIYWV
jgi:hypothetical protein